MSFIYVILMSTVVNCCKSILEFRCPSSFQSLQPVFNYLKAKWFLGLIHVTIWTSRIYSLKNKMKIKVAQFVVFFCGGSLTYTTIYSRNIVFQRLLTTRFWAPSCFFFFILGAFVVKMFRRKVHFGTY